MRAAAKIIAGAIQGAPKKHAEKQGSGRYRGQITSWRNESDFKVDLHGVDLPLLDEDDITLGQSVRKYHATTGLEVGDVLVLMELSEDDFVAVDVESENDPL